MDNLLQISALTALAMFGLIAGFFYAFSVCVMPGLDRVNASAAIEAMQGINEAVRNPVFFMTFFVTPIVALVAAAFALKSGALNSAILMGAAAFIYVIGGIVLTATINVPMNEALAIADPASSDAAQIWADYSQRWTFWNSVRTIASLVAMLTFAFAMRFSQTAQAI